MFDMPSSSPIYINGKFLIQRLTGVQRFAIEIIKRLDESLRHRDSPLKIIMVIPSRPFELKFNLTNVQIIWSPTRNIFIWEQLVLPMITRNRLLLNLTGSSPILKLRQICTIHDAAIYDFPFAYSAKFVWWYKLLFWTQSKINNLPIITVSEFSKKRISHWLKLKGKDIVVIGNGSEHFYENDSKNGLLDKFELDANKYFVAIGSMNPTKNLDRLLVAFRDIKNLSGYKLVVVGGQNNKVFKFDSNLDLVSGDGIVFTGYIDDASLKHLYQNAAALVFPSIYEGFGIPLLEAAACGCPIIASDAASIPEICGDAAIYFDPYSAQSISSTIAKCISDPMILMNNRSRVVGISKKFTWKLSGERLLTLIQNLRI